MNYKYTVADLGFDVCVGPLKDPESFDEKTDVLDLFYYAFMEMKQLNVGEEFLLKDLFKGYIWKRLSQAQKAELGRLVSDYVYNYSFHGVEEYLLSCVGKTKQGQLIFRIIENEEEMQTAPRKGKKLELDNPTSLSGNPEAKKLAFYMAIAERRSKKK